jgi:hypothetical protein
MTKCPAIICSLFYCSIGEKGEKDATFLKKNGLPI